MLLSLFFSLKYSIVEGNVQGSFSIDQYNGVIKTTRKLDRENRASYRLTVLGQNTRNSCHKGRAVVLVDVADINDHSPVFAHAQYSATIPEGKPANTLVAKVTATDKDAGTNAQLTYSISSGNQDNKFSINSIGEVRSTQELDFEVKQSYSLGIAVKDGASPSRSASTTLTVVVQDVNEPPYFVKQCARNNTCKFTVQENKPNTVLGNIQAKDPDNCNSLTYKIKTEQSQGVNVFAVSNTGQITVLTPLDREFRSHYTAVVTAADCGTPALKVSTRITVEVLDENDNSPRFALKLYKASVYENIAKNSVVLQVSASGEWYSLVKAYLKSRTISVIGISIIRDKGRPPAYLEFTNNK